MKKKKDNGRKDVNSLPFTKKPRDAESLQLVEELLEQKKNQGRKRVYPMEPGEEFERMMKRKVDNFDERKTI